jgi:molybdenum cofactor guanylyltransferase
LLISFSHKVNSPFSAVLLAGGKSSRMGHDKALIPIDGLPLWERQLLLVQQLAPMQTFLSGPPRARWDAGRYTVIEDVQPDAGPLAGLVAALRVCSARHLLALAIDLPKMTTPYLEQLLASCRADVGVVPKNGRHFEPVAAVYPKSCLPRAEEALATGEHALQDFAEGGVAEGWLIERAVAPEEAPLFLNMNTPADLAEVTSDA